MFAKIERGRSWRARWLRFSSLGSGVAQPVARVRRLRRSALKDTHGEHFKRHLLLSFSPIIARPG
jgi:hypothetical protein